MGKSKSLSTDNSFDPLYLIEDEPILNTDGLGILPHAKAIAGTALGTKGPFNIGVYGNWGQGKSSLLRLVKHLLDERNDNNLITVWFNAWQYEKEDIPIIPLIANIVSAIDEKTKKGIGAKIKDTLVDMAAVLASIGYSLKIKLPAVFEMDAKDIRENIAKFQGAKKDFLDKSIYFNLFEKLTEITSKVDKNNLPKIVVLVDDLDRCLPALAVKLLEGIKLILNQPGFIFILAVDRRILEGYLIKKYQDDGVDKYEECGSQYLDKIIQLPIFIPNHESRFGNFIDHLIKSNNALNSQHNKGVRETISSLKEVLSIGSDYNPRALIRFINNLIIDRQLLFFIAEREMNNEMIEICAVCRILREHLKDDYRILVETPELLTALGRSPKINLTEAFANVKHTERISHLFKRFERDAFLLKVIQTTAGQNWLCNDGTRKTIDDFIKMTREEVNQNLTNDKKLIEDVIRDSLKLKKDNIVWNKDVLEKVTIINLGFTNFSDEGMKYLLELNNLNELHLAETKITDEGMKYLEDLKLLIKLDLNGTQITDNGLRHIEGLTNLTHLNLRSTQITDNGMQYIGSLANLTQLYIQDTKISGNMIHELRRTNKNLVIIYK